MGPAFHLSKSGAKIQLFFQYTRKKNFSCSSWLWYKFLPYSLSACPVQKKAAPAVANRQKTPLRQSSTIHPAPRSSPSSTASVHCKPQPPERGIASHSPSRLTQPIDRTAHINQPMVDTFFSINQRKMRNFANLKDNTYLWEEYSQ